MRTRKIIDRRHSMAWGILPVHYTTVLADAYHLALSIVTTRYPHRYAKLRRTPEFIRAWEERVMS